MTTDDIYNYRYHPSVANVDRIEFEVKVTTLSNLHYALVFIIIINFNFVGVSWPSG